MGARPLRRTIEQYLEDPLAEKLLMHPNEGRKCMVTVEGDHLVFKDQEVFLIEKKDKDKEKNKDKEKGQEKDQEEDKSDKSKDQDEPKQKASSKT